MGKPDGTTHCVICGAELSARRKHYNAITCDKDEGQRRRKRDLNVIRLRNVCKEKKQEKPRKKKKPPSLVEIARAARAANMTYGECVATHKDF